ncbi:MAG: hypothetical protein ACE1ZQ_11260 [Ignavibacteriaceae bacterium]
MMAEGQITLNDFFSTDQVIDEQLDKLEKSEHFTTLKEKVFKTVRLPAGIYKLLIRQVSDLLNINILEILAGGWGKYSEFLEYLDKEKYPPDETVFVPLIEHKLISKHSPSLQLVINEKSLGKIEFDVNLEFLLKGAILKIRDGKIMGVKFGTVEGKGDVQYDGFKLFEAKSHPIGLPVNIDLNPGIPIIDPGEGASKMIDEVVQS